MRRQKLRVHSSVLTCLDKSEVGAGPCQPGGAQRSVLCTFPTYVQLPPRGSCVEQKTKVLSEAIQKGWRKAAMGEVSCRTWVRDIPGTHLLSF